MKLKELFIPDNLSTALVITHNSDKRKIMYDKNISKSQFGVYLDYNVTSVCMNSNEMIVNIE